MNVSFKMADLYKGVDPYRVYDELAVLGDNVKPAEIVEAAKDEESELHKCFEWDDTKAAHKYRLTQARTLVLNLVITESKPTEEPQQVRVMNTSKDGGYKQTKFIVQDKDEYQHMLEKAKAELRAFKKKYAMLQELHAIFELID